MRGHWLKTLGRAGWSLPGAWLEDDGIARLRRTAVPRMEPGDRLVHYAAGRKRAIAVVEVAAPPTAPTRSGRGGRGASRWSRSST